MAIHSNPRIWYRYLWPKRLTVKGNPAVYRWTFFVWESKKKTAEEAMYADLKRYAFLRAFVASGNLVTIKTTWGGEYACTNARELDLWVDICKSVQEEKNNSYFDSGE